jgi:2-polyprenyl-3-methyl-5-hydroxy-6-metoxy-1,4-benzoquinol methylase
MHMQADTRQNTSKQTGHPWQIEMFRRSIKKQQKLKALLDILGEVNGQRCLLVTCGDNNGALNWEFRNHGGNWTWADVSGEEVDQIFELLGEPVHASPHDRLPFASDLFDVVVSIDVLEHLPHDQPFLLELARVMKKEGRAIVTVPNGDPGLLANRIKWQVGMNPAIYGHVRAGYTLPELGASLTQAGLVPVDTGGYSRFFTEMIELVINYGYVKVLSKKRNESRPGQIAPLSSGELKKHGLAYRLYSLVYPLSNAVSKLDRILPERMDNAVIIAAVKDQKR